MRAVDCSTYKPYRPIKHLLTKMLVTIIIIFVLEEKNHSKSAFIIHNNLKSTSCKNAHLFSKEHLVKAHFGNAMKQFWRDTIKKI